ncbi:MAG: hypothetical protein PW792_14565 [Acidobacteriaceae bacterium]|nr:hypothetical protein [Acidobacteriaceae bacterium]
MNRRRFIYRSSAFVALFRSALRAQSRNTVKITVDPNKAIATIPRDMIGLSYEITQLGDPYFFSAKNKELIHVFQTLSPSGVLRLGGNTSEFTYFASSEGVRPPAYSPLPTQPKSLTAITPKALHHLRAFLEKTGWSCIYGLNLGLGTPERAAEEAEVVSRILGPRLKYLQIGNEANNYVRYQLRPASWGPEIFMEQWSDFAKAILARLPHAKLGGPDMAADPAWVYPFAEKFSSGFGKSLVELTDHFYAEGPPGIPASDIDHLLHNLKVEKEIDVMKTAGTRTRLPYRMTEVNSCYQGGQPGVSDTFASTLWGGDLTLKLISEGFSGVNFHGGSSKEIKASLGGVLPGDSSAKKGADDSYYTPIAGTSALGYTVRPIFQGMAMAAHAAGCTLLETACTDPRIRAYGVQTVTGLEVLQFNMSREPVQLVLNVGSGFRADQAHILSSLALDSAVIHQEDRKLNSNSIDLPAGCASRIVFKKT